MRNGKTSLSKVSSYQEIGEFWDTHDLADFWDQTKPVAFEVELRSETNYYPLERDLAAELGEIARKQGISAETLLNLWVKEKILQQKAAVC